MRREPAIGWLLNHSRGRCAEAIEPHIKRLCTETIDPRIASNLLQIGHGGFYVFDPLVAGLAFDTH